ncbi:uncharacterized protein [Diabrotica undecimpunctata]|uniref:uncharacterized protein n=1 Tax=Diabrotica undecimpunctata TaxID=50387 RepID=UPI003B633E6B
MLSSKPEHTLNFCTTGKKKRSKPREEPVEYIFKPQVIQDYNKAKKGVDYSDQMAAYYSSLRRGLKWYHKVVFELIFGATIINSWIIYNKTNIEKKIPMLTFREQLALQLSNQNECISETNLSKRKHCLQREEGPGRKRRRNCVDCYKKLRQTMKSKEADKKVTKVNTFCENCEKKPALCLTCFNDRHI